MANTSVLGEKFVFSHYLEPVSEDVREKELENIDAWLEANESCNKEEVETPSADDQDAAADNTATDSEACKEDAEAYFERLKECVILYEATGEDKYAEMINEFNSDVKAAYASRRYAEKNSGSHKSIGGVMKSSDALNQAAKTVNDKGAYKNEFDKKPLATTAKEKKAHDLATNLGTKQTESLNKKQDKNREANIKKAEAGKEIKKSSRDYENRLDKAEKFVKSKPGQAVAKAIGKHYAKKLAKEAVEQWYAENGIEFTDYEDGCTDMFIESFLNEKSNFDKFISSHNAKADENEKKAKQMEKIAADNPRSKAGEAANQKAQDYKNAAYRARHPKEIGKNSWGDYKSTGEIQQIKTDSKKSGENEDYYSGDRRDARDSYRDAAANNGRKVATKTRDRQPGTYAKK